MHVYAWLCLCHWFLFFIHCSACMCTYPLQPLANSWICMQSNGNAHPSHRMCISYDLSHILANKASGNDLLRAAKAPASGATWSPEHLQRELQTIFDDLVLRECRSLCLQLASLSRLARRRRSGRMQWKNRTWTWGGAHLIDTFRTRVS